MKGLLLKDFYMLTKYGRSFLLIIMVFIAVSCFGNDSTFFAIYPTLIAGMISLTLISYDEREKWNMYCETLPCTRAQVVTSKYLVGLLFELAVFILSAAAQAYRMTSTGVFVSGEYISFILAILVIGLIAPGVMLPFVYRFGAEKGRVAYYVVIGALCAGGTVLAEVGFKAADNLNSVPISFFITIVAAAIYICSWRISIIFYKKREL